MGKEARLKKKKTHLKISKLFLEQTLSCSPKLNQKGTFNIYKSGHCDPVATNLTELWVC